MNNRKTAKRILSALLTLVIMLMCVITPEVSITADAQTKRTGLGLAEFGLKAYADGWLYNYGSWGQLSSSGKRMSDCSGLIYAYLCWDENEAAASPSYTPTANWNWPRGAQSQYDYCVATGPISTLPRTHGLLIFYPNCDHVGIYVGNGNAVDNSEPGVNMIYSKVSSRGWVSWGKLKNVEYPTNGWYKFNGHVYYYQNGEYVVSKTLNIDGVKYTFSSSGIPNPTPQGYTQGGGIVDENGSTSDNCSVTYYVTAQSGLILRQSPNYGTPIKTLPYGTKVTVTNRSNVSWYKVKLSDGTVGYCSSTYLSKTNPNATPTPKPSPTPIPVAIPAKTTSAVYVRKAASASSASIKVLASGSSVTITDKTTSKSWYKVKLSDGTVGYIYASYLKAVPISPYYAKTNRKCILRSKASSSSTAVKTLALGAGVTCIKLSNNGYWMYVTANSGHRGWVPAPYLKKATTTLKGTTTTSLSMRKSPSSSSAVKKTLAKGTKVIVTNTASYSGWLRVTLYDGNWGWVKSPYVSVSVPAKTTGWQVNVRSKPSTSSSVVYNVYASGTKVTIIRFYNKSWYRVKLSNGKTGYMSTTYVKRT
ncbi:MAG: SH3 domain-containing protein [Clostridia bacterium]|nr:SH3 domain-containing protein [Clostridia bacterium]